jgi:anti-anti-sigma factor
MRDILNIHTSDGPQAAARGPHYTEPANWGPIAPREAELLPRLLVRPVGDVIVVKCFSTQMHFDDQETAEIGASLLGLVRFGYVRILLNLQGVHFASGSLLASLAWLHQKVIETKGFLRLFGMEPVVCDALRICRLDTTFEIYASEAEALAARVRERAPVASARPTGSCGQ